MNSQNWSARFAGMLLSACFSLPVAYADDTEIFFGQTDDAFNTNPNILFILDTSGSMNALDGGSLSRMERLKQAMGLILDQSSSYNVGLMGFSGWGHGGSIRYPVGYLESDSTEYCPETGCPDETVIARPSSAAHDAMENDDSKEVELYQQFLTLTEVLPAGGSTPPPAADTETTVEYLSSVDYSEAHETSDDSWTAAFNDDPGTWFYQSTGDKVRHAYWFEDVVIPDDATITASYIEFTHSGNANQLGDLGAYIMAEATGAPSHYQTGVVPEWTPLFERTDPINSASVIVSWSDIPPSATNPDLPGKKLHTPDLSALISEVSSLPSWPAVGGDLSVLLDPHDTYPNSLTNSRKIYGSTSLEARRPKLVITYTQPATPAVISVSENYTATAHLDQVTEDVTGYIARNQSNAASRIFHAGTDNLPRQLGFRFDNIAVPQGATITSATLSLTSETAAIEDPDTAWVPDSTPLSGGGTPPTPPPGPYSLTINISAEMSEAPEAYSGSDLSSRAYTTNFVAWENVPTTTEGVISSPELITVLEELTGLSTWASGSSVSLLLSAPSTYDNVPLNSLLAHTSSGVGQPVLELTWDEPDTVAPPDPETHTTGIRFVKVHVPPGAQIKSAHLGFTSHSAEIIATSIDISGEDIGTPIAFIDANNDLGSRTRTTAREVWDVLAFDTVGAQIDSTDVTSIVQEIVSRSDWCGGNPMHFFLKGTGLREVVSYDQNPVESPTLNITYEPASVPAGNYCSNSSVVVSIADDADDAVENTSNGTVTIGGNSLAANSMPDGSGDEQTIGLRFQGLQVPQGAVVVSASLELTTDFDVTSPEDFTISVENTDSATAFSTTSNDISGRTYSGLTENWTVQLLAAGEGAFTSDLTSLVSAVTGRVGWQAGNDIAFKLDSASATSEMSFGSISAGEVIGARLIVNFQDLRAQPGTVFRENLKNQINDLVAQNGTPIVEAYYEAAQYFSADPIHFGLKRGAQGYNDRYHRVSHPFSYTGGAVYRAGTCNDSNLDNSDCSTEKIESDSGATPTYLSPIEGQCQTNHIVLLTDGEPTSNLAINLVENKIGVTCANTTDTDEKCGRELAYWMANTDMDATLPGTQSIKTHTIGFNLSTPQFLEDIADNGEGGFYPASSAAELLTAFKNIFVNVSKVDTTFVAPSATVNQFNRLKNRDDLYFSLFKPESTSRWSGNVKRYKLHSQVGANAVIHDVFDQPAINEATGEFFPNSRSWWSSVTDGPSVLLGGAAEQIEHDGVSHLSRKVYTYTGVETQLNQLQNELLPYNTNIDLNWFDLAPVKASDTNYVADLINWAHGQDINDLDGDSDTDEARGEMGDPMHSRPILVNYAADKSVLYVATNEGYLHAFDHDTGHEEFAFIPKELLKNLDAFYQNTPTLNRPYGLDGGITTWTEDTNGNGVVDGSEKVYLVVGMRRGGNSYFALDISDYNNPKYMWSINGGTTTIDTDPTTADGDFEELGQTWSKPVKAKVMDYEVEKDVLIFAAGYDPNQDPSPADIAQPRSQDGIGRGIFIVDAHTGEELWHTNRNDHPDMNYSMPSEVKVIDINFDGMADQLYLGDMGGQVWRFDINNDTNSSDSLTNRVTGDVIAQFGDDDPADARKFYYPPDLSVVSTDGIQQLAVSIGSGWRAHPLDTHVEDRFYSFRMAQVYGAPVSDTGQVAYPEPINESELIDVTNSIGNVLTGTDNGWMIRLGTNGEKVLTTSVTADNQVLFTSYQPATAASTCSAAVGSGALYALHLRNGDPVVDFDDSGGTTLTASDRKEELDHAGIPPDTTVLFPEAGKATLVIGTETVDEIDIGELRRRSFWAEVLED